jgi:16S rRNA (guanine(966)-N(2))-methyltransferase RsmD
MRVISGTAKGRNLKSPGRATRPITDRVKENLFNILAPEIPGANVLDLFAGAGSVAVEALSRGARFATLVEMDREALNAIRENLTMTGLAERANVLRQDVFKFLARGPVERYDLIYVAPPQYRGLWAKTLALLDSADFLTDDGVIVVQIHPKEYQEIELHRLVLADQRKYGSTLLCFYRPSTPAANA